MVVPNTTALHCTALHCTAPLHRFPSNRYAKDDNKVHAAGTLSWISHEESARVLLVEAGAVGPMIDLLSTGRCGEPLYLTGSPAAQREGGEKGVGDATLMEPTRTLPFIFCWMCTPSAVLRHPQCCWCGSWLVASIPCTSLHPNTPTCSTGTTSDDLS